MVVLFTSRMNLERSFSGCLSIAFYHAHFYLFAFFRAFNLHLFFVLTIFHLHFISKKNRKLPQNIQNLCFIESRRIFITFYFHKN